MDFFKYECEFCGQRYKRETSFLKHNCKEKIRTEEMKTPDGHLAFALYRRWLQQIKRGKANKSSFMNSQYYKSFFAIADYVKKLDISRPSMFVDYMSSKKYIPTIWTKREAYVGFLDYMDNKIPPSKLVEISIDTIMDFCDEKEIPYSEFFRHIAPNDLINLMESRRMSPWLLFTSGEFKEFYNGERISMEQREIITTFLNKKVWKKRFENHPRVLDRTRRLVEELGL
jgi:hypothetical protein